MFPFAVDALGFASALSSGVVLFFGSTSATQCLAVAFVHCVAILLAFETSHWIWYIFLYWQSDVGTFDMLRWSWHVKC